MQVQAPYNSGSFGASASTSTTSSGPRRAAAALISSRTCDLREFTHSAPMLDTRCDIRNWKPRAIVLLANIGSTEAARGKAGDHDQHQVIVVGAPHFRSVRQATPSKGACVVQTIARRDAVSVSAEPFTSSYNSGGTPRKAALALRTALLTVLRVVLN